MDAMAANLDMKRPRHGCGLPVKSMWDVRATCPFFDMVFDTWKTCTVYTKALAWKKRGVFLPTAGSCRTLMNSIPFYSHL